MKTNILKLGIVLIIGILFSYNTQAQVTLNCESGNRATDQANCWGFGATSYSQTLVIDGAWSTKSNSLTNISLGASWVKTPWMKMGNGNITFKTRLDGAGNGVSMKRVVVSYVKYNASNSPYYENDPVRIDSLEFTNFSSTAILSGSITIPAIIANDNTNIYKILFSWIGTGGNERAYSDDFVIPGTYWSDPSNSCLPLPLAPVADPTFSPAAGTYTSAQSVTISTTTSGASIRYTTDGTAPSDVNGTLYTGVVNVSQNTTLKACAYKTNMPNSSVVSGVYTIKCVAPTFSVPAGTYTVQQSLPVSLSTTTLGATIRYTIDGSTPTESNGTVYSSAINISTTTTLKAIAYKSGLADSDPSIAIYTIFIDADGDGVPDAEDAYPTDPTRAFNNYYPASATSTLAFEDLWPSKGDYDMNDIVVDYQFKNVINTENKLIETFATFTLRATGASFYNGFGFQLSSNNIPNSAMQVTGSAIHENYVMLNANGTEQGQNKPTIIVFDNAFDVLRYPGSGYGINTIPGITYSTPVTITIHITYTPNTYTAADLDITHFNPFIIVNKERGKEVHLPDYAPTALANPAYFGTGDDKSNPSQGKYYKTANNLPWALNLSSTFSYPIEKAEITKAYLHFIDWVVSNGTDYTDWYTNTAPGYRNNNNIYSSGKK